MSDIVVMFFFVLILVAPAMISWGFFPSITLYFVVCLSDAEFRKEIVLWVNCLNQLKSSITYYFSGLVSSSLNRMS